MSGLYQRLYSCGCWQRASMRLFVVLALLSLSTSQSQCPDGCGCQTANNNIQIQCNQQLPADKLMTEIDRFLSNQSIDHISSLEVVNTSLTSVPSSVCRLSALRSLRLSSNRLTRLPNKCLNRMSKLEQFYADDNGLIEIQDGLFDGLNRLRSIDASRNRIRTIGLGVFSNTSDLLGLTSVDLHLNELDSLEPWPTMRAVALGKTALSFTADLGNNRISRFTNLIGWLYDCELVRGYLRLSNNRISHFRDWTIGWGIDSLTSLICLYGHMVPFWTDFSRNPFVCDCVDFYMFSFLNKYQRATTLNECYCELPLELNSIQIKRVPPLLFTCPVVERCPIGCGCIDRPGNSTMHVNCIGSNLTALPLVVPKLPKSHYRYVLDFAGSERLTRIEPRYYLPKTAMMNASNCSIDEIDVEAWEQMMSMVAADLSGNRLETVSESLAAVNVTGSAVFNLNANPWDCSCKYKHVKKWILRLRDRLQSSNILTCSSPQRLWKRNVVSVPDDEFCVDPTVKMAAVVSSSTGGFFLLVCLTVGLAYRCRHRLYSKVNIHPFDRDECAGEEMDYDVFLVSSADDGQLSVPMLRMLEDEGYAVCFEPKDFMCGGVLQNDVVSAIFHSKRTLFLLTQNFVESAHCMEQFHVALQNNITLRKNRIIVIVTTPTDPRRLLRGESPELAALRQYLSRHGYIVYGSNGWLRRLLYDLPINRINAADADVLLVTP